MNQNGSSGLEQITPCQAVIMHEYLQTTQKDFWLNKDDLLCLSKEEPIIISENTTWDQSLDIHSDIIIEPGKNLVITCDIRMAKGTNIIVKKPGGILMVANGSISAICPAHRWGGVIVEGNKDLPAITVFQGNVILSGAEISYAQIGIMTWHFENGFSANWGGTVSAFNSRFVNNVISVYSGLGPLPFDGQHRHSFTNCEFIVDDQFLTGEISYPVVIVGNRGASFSRCNFINTRRDFDDIRTPVIEEFHSVEQLGIGILSGNGGFIMRSSYKPASDNPGVIDSEIKGFHTGIRATSSTTPYNFSIRGIRITENYLGVVARAVNNFEIKFCDIVVGNLCHDQLMGPAPFYEGIVVQHGNGFDISNNEFFDQTMNLPFGCAQLRTFGLRIAESGGVQTDVEKNKYQGFNDANRAEGLCRDLKYFDVGLQYSCNSHEGLVNGNSYDISLLKLGVRDGIRGFQGELNRPAANLFSKLTHPVGSDMASTMDWPVNYFYYPDDLLERPKNILGNIFANDVLFGTSAVDCGTIGHQDFESEGDSEVYITMKPVSSK